MLPEILFFVIWGLFGTAVGRILFVKRLGNSVRFQIGEARDDDGWGRMVKVLVKTEDHASAQAYGLWSIPLWPLTLALFTVQMPTRQEKRLAAASKTAELMMQYEL